VPEGEDAGDSRQVVTYLVVPETDEYVAVMAVLESSVSDLTPRDVVRGLLGIGVVLDERVVEKRLDQLRLWGAATARTDTSRILRHADLLARNWRWTATPAGRQVQRFYTTVLAETPTMREVPLSSLARVVDCLEELVGVLLSDEATHDRVAELIGRLFTSHDDLDAALVGAEDSLAGLADRFDLDDASTAELKRLLVDYATRVAAELETGAARGFRALDGLRDRFGELASIAVENSDARALIDRGALLASRGGRRSDWEGLRAWCDPEVGRASRFALRLVRALPGMHANLRRLHASVGTATGRGRAVMLARACSDPVVGQAIFVAALGDHAWRKLSGEAADHDLTHNPPWRDGPRIAVPELLRATGREGARGRAPAAKDNTAAREEIRRRRAERAELHSLALQEVLAATAGQPLSDRAARAAFAALMAAARARPGSSGSARRTAVFDGLACSMFHCPGRTGELLAPTWRVITPDRLAVFHRPGLRPGAPAVTAPDDVAIADVRGSWQEGIA
jgi:uncharacterized protein (TIGR02677 family)